MIGNIAKSILSSVSVEAWPHTHVDGNDKQMCGEEVVWRERRQLPLWAPLTER